MDYYKIEQDWNTCKDLITELENDVNFFIKKPTIRKWSTLVRKKAKNVDDIGYVIKKNIMKQRQDTKSDYS